MTATQRQTLRQLIDHAVRAKLEQDRIKWQRCAGCDCASENNTIGCKTCSDRHNRRRRRFDPRTRSLEQQRQRESRHRRRLALKAA